MAAAALSKFKPKFGKEFVAVLSRDVLPVGQEFVDQFLNARHPFMLSPVIAYVKHTWLLKIYLKNNGITRTEYLETGVPTLLGLCR